MPAPQSRALLPGGRIEILRLYKALLYNAKRFPSRKRESIYQDIRIEFREKALLTDEAAIAHALEVAVRGLGTMTKYTSLDRKAKDWSVHLEDDPLGAGAAENMRVPSSAAISGGIVDAGVKATFGKLE